MTVLGQVTLKYPKGVIGYAVCDMLLDMHLILNVWDVGLLDIVMSYDDIRSSMVKTQ